jgi:pimeloyl-ACP methyl ester carboxylesterase
MSPTHPIEPFEVSFDPAEVRQLRARLRNTRWPERETVAGWSQGVPLNFVQELASFWCEGYDFDAAAARLNRWPQFKSRIDDLALHFVHSRSPEPDALPLVMTHGWPGSHIEFLDVIERLVDPASTGGDAGDAFHVVCPSLPGYGFSDRPTTRGRGVPWIARALNSLMLRLGYCRFGAQGGDWGAAVTIELGDRNQDHVVGIHITMPSVDLPAPTEDSTPNERRAYDDHRLHAAWGRGYEIQQSTRPQTVGYGLVDSPAGQLAWLVEKYWGWTDCGGDPYSIFTRDQLLDVASVYWFTATGASSARLYWESLSPTGVADPEGMMAHMGEVTVATACSVFPREIRRPSRRQAETRFRNIQYWNEPARGGHFAAFEQPALFVDEVRAAFRRWR